MTGNTPDPKGQPGIAAAALFALCPRCGARTLFSGLASFAPRCRACGLDLAQFNVGDGPAAFLTLVIGAVVVGLGAWVELTWSPPLWVHALLWIPLTAGLTIWGLRAGKAALLASEYRMKAGEGRLKDE